MTIGSLWLPSLGAAPPGFTPSNTPTLSTANGGTTTSGTVTLPATTATNDCIVLGLSFTTPLTLGVSGAGASWSLIQVGSPSLCLAVGYGCTSGATTVTYTGGGSNSIQWNASIWKTTRHDASPVVSNVTGTATGVDHITSSSLSFAAHQVVISMNQSDGNASATIATTYSSGDTSNLIHYTGSAALQTQSSYITPGSPPGSTTVNASAGTGINTNWFQAVIVLNGS